MNSHAPVSTFRLRASWQFAIFGIAGFALVSTALAICRACGIFEFWIEKLPGVTLLSVLGPVPGSRSWDVIEWLIYFGLGALLGIAYRFAFRVIGRSNWQTGFFLGLLQWAIFGILIALTQPGMQSSQIFLPTLPPLDSIAGISEGAFILVLSCFYGALIGALSAEQLPRLQEEEETEEAKETEKRAA